MFTNFSLMFLKALFLVLFSSSCTPLLLVQSFLTNLQIITSMQMTLKFTHHFQQLVFLATSLFLKLLFHMFQTRCLPILSHSIPSKHNFLSLACRRNSLSSTLILIIYQTMSIFHLLTLLVTLVSSLIKICLFVQTFQLIPNPDSSSSIFVIYGAFTIFGMRYCLNHCYVSHSL